MNIDEMFRHFFGFNNHPRSHRDSFPYCEDPDDDEVYSMDSGEFGSGGEFQFSIFPSPLGIMRHFEEMFRSFGLAENPTFGYHMDHIEPRHGEAESPRDKMLKDDNKFIPNFQKPWYRGILDKPEDGNTHRGDSDLDKEFSEGAMRELIPKPNIEKDHSFFSSISIRTIRSADGKMEEHRTVRDSTGKNETTVRRIIGDESHSVRTLEDSKGLKERREDFVNLDEGSLQDFNRKWERKDLFVQPPAENQFISRDDSYSSIFKKLFGFSPSTT